MPRALWGCRGEVGVQAGVGGGRAGVGVQGGGKDGGVYGCRQGRAGVGVQVGLGGVRSRLREVPRQGLSASHFSTIQNLWKVLNRAIVLFPPSQHIFRKENRFS